MDEIGKTVDRLVVRGGAPLIGSIDASGSKNACLPIMAASILAGEPVELERVPNISDVATMIKILTVLGVTVTFDKIRGHMVLDATDILTTVAPEEYVSRMNASFDVMGPLLARCGEGEVGLPGGCRLGQRRVNYHIEVFKKLGAEVTTTGGSVKAKVPSGRLKGALYTFPTVSVGATENAMMAAVLADGVTVLEGCAREPEVTDLANFLVTMGAKIEGIGTQTLRIEGVKKLHGTKYRVMADRIEACTYLVGAVMTKGDITVNKFESKYCRSFLDCLRQAGQEVIEGGDYIRVKGGRPILPLDIVTAPYPGFPTDLHPPVVAMLALAEGVSSLQETIFDGRFMYIMELVRLGADLLCSGNYVRIRHVDHFVGAPVNAPDIRAGGALILAALAAEGESLIRGVRYIDRGYQNIEDMLKSLGGSIRRVTVPLTELE